MDFIRHIQKFLFPKKGELYHSLKTILTFSPHDLTLYRLALLHKSMSIKDGDGRYINNERLEFLGDAILEAVVSNYLFRKYPDKPEGFLTTTRSKIVRRSSLGNISHRIGLDALVRSSILSDAHNSYISGNAFEALVGAIYLDRGYIRCQQFFNSLIERGYVNLDKMVHKEQNYKSLLLEWCQKYRVQIDFESIETAGTSWERKAPFRSTVLLEGHSMGHGFGYSKKESHQNAARRVLQRFRENPRVVQHLHEDRLSRHVINDATLFFLNQEAPNPAS